jgi:hypothetical protein
VKRRQAVLSLIVVLSLPSGLEAQWTDAQLPKRGELQVGIAGQNITVDHRFTPDGSKQPLTEMFAAELDSRLVPPLDSLDVLLSGLFPALGLSTPQASTLGPVRYDVLLERTRVPISLTFSVVDWLAVFTVVPLVRSQSFVGTQIDSLAANSGPESSAFGGDPDAFFTDLSTGITSLDSIVAEGTLPPDQQAEAVALLADARLLESGLLQMRDLEYVPSDSGGNGRQLSGFYADLETGFQAFEVALPTLSFAGPIDADEAQALTSGPQFGIEPIQDRDTGIKLGDVEAGISVQPLNTFPRRPGEDRATFPLRLRLDALYRFPTGTPPIATRLTDIGAGQGQPDLEFRSTLDVAFGSRFWLSVFAGYNIQMEAEVERLVTSRETPIQLGAYTALIAWDPGDVLTLAAVPRFNFTRNITFSFLYAIRRHGMDQVTPVDPVPDGAAFVPSDLEEGSEYNSRSLGFTARYSSTEWSGDRRSGIPVEVELTYLNTTKGTDGFVPKRNVWQVGLRLYQQIFR